MLPLLPFVAGIATGALAIKLWRADKSRLRLDLAQEKLRNATVSSLEAIEHSSASMRERLSAGKKPADKPKAAPKTAAAKKPAARKPAVKKPAAPAVEADKTGETT